jgi:hypothetical protein
MALSATTIFEVETGGSDTLNGGAFDPGQTAGMLTDGAATVATGTAPVFTSASYNFVAGDVGAWVYIASGSNWIPGWYKIASVASNAATLNATIGQAVLKAALTPSTVAGCATTASPTVATWTIDYSQQSSAAFSYTDLASAGTGLTVSSAAKPFGKQQVGNALVITGGTNFNAGRYVIASIGAVNVATVVGPTNVTTGAGVTGTGGLGGALASLGIVSSVIVNSNAVFVKSGSYTVTSATTSIAAGCFSSAGTNLLIMGYGSVRGDFGTAPVLTAGTISTFSVIAISGVGSSIQNVTVDCASKTSSRAFNSTQSDQFIYKCLGKNATNSAFGATSNSSIVLLCQATGCATNPAINCPVCIACESFSNTVTGFSGASFGFFEFCLSYNNSGASSDGFADAGPAEYLNCVSYGNGRDGFRAQGNIGETYVNCIAEANSGFGFNGNSLPTRLFSCGGYNNTSGQTNQTTTYVDQNIGFINNTTGTFFVNAAGGNFALNQLAGQGALARAAGIPGPFPAGTTTGFLDLGAAQHQDSPDVIAPVYNMVETRYQ